MPAASEGQMGDTIKGIAASGGQVTAPARVLGGPGDFGQMRPGVVLVAAITTPAWTSLFAMASAVVTDVGGPLSHSSIVAREYGIPAVLGTGVATRRIQSEQNIHVDGDAGTVLLLDGSGRDYGGRPAEVASEPAASSMAGKLALVTLAGVVLITAFARWRRCKRA
jgi:phosphoenolpyruvate synthase/pyruvate phosphate dikinase